MPRALPVAALFLLVFSSGLSAQVPPEPPRPPLPAQAPMPATAPRAEPRPAPAVPARPAQPWFEAQRAQLETLRELQSRDARALGSDAARFQVEAAQAQREMQREVARLAEEAVRFGAESNYGRAYALAPAMSGQLGVAGAMAPFAAGQSSFYRPPQAWAQSDPADSLYKTASQALNRGDYRKAASLFKELPQKHPNSAYAPEAYYYQATALYRIGSSAELQEALAVLDALKTKYPESNRMRGRYNDAGPLATRIAGVLAARGMGDRDLVKKALTDGANGCDQEEQSVKVEALNALQRTDSDAALQLARRMLAKKDDCSVQLRRSAIWVVAKKPDATTTATLVSVAKTDASPDLRAEATSFLASMQGDDALAALEELTKSDDARVRRAAVRALTTHPSPRARGAMRALIERNDTPEDLRIAALDAFERDRASMDDATWMRNIYSKVDNPTVRAALASAVGRIGGESNDQWLLGLSKNEDESIDVRLKALRRVSQTVDIANLVKFYDNVSARPLREEIINALGNRTEPQAIDKLLDIVKNSTDPQVRRSAISQLTRKKDPRATQALLDIIDKKP